MKYILFSISLVLLIVSIILIVEFPESGRMSLIAGVLFPIAFGLNIASFLMKSKVKSI